METKFSRVVTDQTWFGDVQSLPEDRALDLQGLSAEIERRTANLDPTRTFSLSELARETGESEANLLYLEQKYSLLRPFSDKKGAREVRRYTVSDLRNALFAVRLKEQGYTPKQIAPLLRTWQEHGAPSGAYVATPIIHAGMNFIERVKVQVLARLLQIVLQKICADEVLRDALIVIRQTSLDPQQREARPIQVSPRTKGDVAPLIRMYRQIPIGWSTAEGEVFTRYKDIEDLIGRLDSWDLLAVTIDNPPDQHSYEVVLGLVQESADPQLLAVKHWLRQEYLPLTSSDRMFLCKLMDIIFSVMLNLDEVVRSLPPTRYRLVSQGDMLSVLADAIVAIAPAKWDYCGILLPFGDELPTLQMAAVSAAFPQALRQRALYPTGQSLPSWVYTAGEPLVVNRVVDKDPRVLFQELERPTAIAVVPALAMTDEAPKGVVYVGTRRPQDDREPAFTELDLKVLGVFGEIAGEIIGRQRLNEQVVTGALKISSLPPVSYADSMDFEEVLRNVLMGISETAQEGRETDDSLLILAIRISNYDQLKARDLAVASWAAGKVREKIGRFLEARKVSPPETRPVVYQLGADRFVALINRVGSNVKELREELRIELKKLGSLGMAMLVEAHVWSLHFAYRDLVRRFNLEEADEQAVDQAIDMLVKRTDGALKVLTYIQQGDEYLRRRDFEKARVQYELAHHHDPENPYHLRHLAECLIEMGRYEEAIEAAQQAVELDPSYPGSYRRLAEAYIGKSDFDQGFKLYEEAIKLQPNDPITRLRYGQALMLHADQTNIKRAINEFQEAMACDQPTEKIQARYLGYIGQAWARSGDYDAAIDRYQQALAFDPGNEDIWWDLQMAKNALARSRDQQAA